MSYALNPHDGPHSTRRQQGRRRRDFRRWLAENPQLHTHTPEDLVRIYIATVQLAIRDEVDGWHRYTKNKDPDAA